MNILPKKRWHVRTKDNIARVRRDEAKAAADERERERRVQLAEQEARTTVLRGQVQLRHGGSAANVEFEDSGPFVEPSNDGALQHLNFFPEVAEGQKSWGINKEHEAEKKKEQEKYEQSIGLLMYLGQTSLQNKEQPWYYKAPEERHRTVDDNTELKTKSKSFLDPLKNMHAYMKMLGKKSSIDSGNKGINAGKAKLTATEAKSKHKSSKRDKSHKHHSKEKRKRGNSSSSSEECTAKTTDSKEQTLEKLRAERLRRERRESVKAERLLTKLHGGVEKVVQSDRRTRKTTMPQPDGDQGYNSQFNPHLIRRYRPNNFHIP